MEGTKMKTLMVALVILLLWSGSGSACWCGGEPLQYWFDLSDIVFSGIVTSFEPGNLLNPARYELTVTGCWKGVSEPGSVVTVRSEYTSCVFLAAAVGEEWVMFGVGPSPSGGYYTGQCYPNREFPMPPAHEAFLGPSICSPVSVESGTWGRIKATYR